MRNPIAPKCGPSHQFVMNPALIQKELGIRNEELRKDDSQERRLRDGGGAAGMPILALTAAPIRNPLEPRVGHLDG